MNKKRNLWKETIDFLKSNGLTWDDVLYVQGYDFQIPKENFQEIAEQTNYDAGYGAQEVAEDLVIGGWDWWMERVEYDGSECWRFYCKPEPVLAMREIQTLTSSRGWESLYGCNERFENDKEDK